MKVAILYICTGKYSVFWDQFYKSCEQYFLPGYEKHYFVFTDTLHIDHVPDRVHLKYQEKLGWPHDTLMRFHMFAGKKGELQQFDFIFFLNANAHFIKTIDESILSDSDDVADLVVVRHPFFYRVEKPSDFPYERRPKSLAFIPKKKGAMYILGGFNGGRSSAYLELIESLKQRIDTDEKNNIIAVWHDESHLNKYILETKKRVKVLDYNFGFPEGHDLPLKEDVYLTFLDKANFGGHDFLREKENSIPSMPYQKKIHPFQWFKQIFKSLI